MSGPASILTLSNGERFEARPLSDPPSAGSVVILYGDNRLPAIARYDGGDVWTVLREIHPITPTHWVVPCPR